MLAFHNDEFIKEKYLSRVKDHYKADEIVKGIYWEDGKGCAVGCTIHGDDHGKYETELGIPKWLARVEDAVFEGLPNDKAKDWPIKFLRSIKIGIDLEKIKIPFLIFVVESTLNTFDNEKYSNVKKSIDRVLNLLKNNFNDTDSYSFASVASAEVADSAAASAAYYAAASVASVAEAAAAYYAAKEKAYEKFADKLIELIEEI